MNGRHPTSTMGGTPFNTGCLCCRVDLSSTEKGGGFFMFTQQSAIRAFNIILIAVLVSLGAISTGPAMAGGLILYEFGTADVGLASSGFNVRAQDASTVFTNPAGMTRLDGTQFVGGGAGALGQHKVLDRIRHVAAARRRRRGLCGRDGRVVPRRRRVPQLQRVARFKARVCPHRQLRGRLELRRRLGRPVITSRRRRCSGFRFCPRLPTR